jgi:hypothetical protein
VLYNGMLNVKTTEVICVPRVREHLAFGVYQAKIPWYDILAQGLIGLIEYSYHQGIHSFSEAQL